MPTMAHKKRAQEIREYFRQNWAAKINDPSEARDDMESRFSFGNKWYSYKPQFAAMIAAARDHGDSSEQVVYEPSPQVEERQGEIISIPADISDEAKDAFNKLLEDNQRLAGEITTTMTELAITRGQLAGFQGRIRLLKKVASDLLDAV